MKQGVQVILILNVINFYASENCNHNNLNDRTNEENDTVNESYAISNEDIKGRLKDRFIEEAYPANDQALGNASHCTYQNSINEEESEMAIYNSYPFSVSIQRKGAHYASGALIDKAWILSSAGAFYYVRESIKLFRARLGSVNCKRHGKTIPLVRIDLHPSYVYGGPSFDVALLRIGIPVDYSSVIRPIQMSRTDAKVLNARFLTTYWAKIIVKGTAIPRTAYERIKYDSMRVSTQNLIPWDMCYEAMSSLNETLDRSSFCLMPIVAHHSVCTPDIGAPVIAEDQLWAITSGWVSNKCPKTPGPTIATRISSFFLRSWLDEKLMDTW